jgi:hypothetical protein
MPWPPTELAPRRCSVSRFHFRVDPCSHGRIVEVHRNGRWGRLRLSPDGDVIVLRVRFDPLRWRLPSSEMVASARYLDAICRACACRPRMRIVSVSGVEAWAKAMRSSLLQVRTAK